MHGVVDTSGLWTPALVDKGGNVSVVSKGGEGVPVLPSLITIQRGWKEEEGTKREEGAGVEIDRWGEWNVDSGVDGGVHGMGFGLRHRKGTGEVLRACKPSWTYCELFIQSNMNLDTMCVKKAFVNIYQKQL